MRPILILITCAVLSCTALADDSRLIRRAYLDLTGKLPTIQEIEWLEIYTREPYQEAVKYLTDVLKKNYKHLSREDTKKHLTSLYYMFQPRKPISDLELRINLLYLAGMPQHEFSDDKIREAKLKLIKIATNPNIIDYDPLDYLANCLMSRSTTADEANKLMKVYKTYAKYLDEEKAWLAVLDELLKLEDVRTK
jgi:hypothetical protein